MLYKKLAFIIVTIVILAGCSTLQGILPTASEQKVEPKATTEASAPQSVDLKNIESLIVVFITPPEIVRKLVPAPLVPTPYNIMYVAVSRSPMGDGFTNSMEMGVSVIHKGKMFNYPVYTVVDNKEASEVGKMITGTPTRIGQITLERKDKNVTAAIVREGKVIFKTNVALGEPGEPLDSMPVINMKVIPGATKDAPPAVKQLTSGKFEKVKVHELMDGEATMDFDQSLTDGFPKVSVQQVYRAVYRKADMTITDAGVLHDYLKAD